MRNSEGSLVSVTDGFTSRLIPTKLLEEYLDNEKITGMQNLEKEIVSIEVEEYVKWYFEIAGIVNERTMAGKWEMNGKIGIEDIEKQYRVAEIELAGVMTPGIVTDKGDHSLVIVEILKKI